MERSLRGRARWIGGTLAGLILVFLLLLAFFDWNSLRQPLARMISRKTGLEATISGDLVVHPWSLSPRVTVNGLRLVNPAWPAQTPVFAARAITIQISVPHLLFGQIVLPRVELDAPSVDLDRPASGKANWLPPTRTGAPPSNSSSVHLPAVRRLIISGGVLRVVDEVRNLGLTGEFAADELARAADGEAFQLHCTGSINQRAFNLSATGGPLINVEPDKPYPFTAVITAGDIHLHTRAEITKPFDLGSYVASFSLAGADLANAYYLTDLALPNTGPYDISGTLRHEGEFFDVDDLHGRIGASDIEGKVAVRLGGPRPLLTAQLSSRRLDLADLAPTLGVSAPTAGPAALTAGGPRPAAPAAVAAVPGAPAPRGPAPTQTLLLPDADLQVDRVRAMDADVRYSAHSVLAPKLPLQDVSFHLKLGAGVLRIDPLSFAMSQGQFSGSVRIDATQTPPDTQVDMKLLNIDLAEFKSASAETPPLSGTLMGRIRLEGRGASVHKFAADSAGNLSFVVPQGQVRSAFAELTGINVARGLGLLVTGDQKQADLRCAVADFTADHGDVKATTLVIDTTNVLINGRGDLNFGDERLNLSIEGDPKQLRFFRLRSPISLSGTLSKPSIGIKPEKTIVQAAAAVALGTLLTPVAAVLAFVDPGLAHNADCAALLAQAESQASANR
jgi:uncharacterized protein involved in outer membrane biogenesis